MKNNEIIDVTFKELTSENLKEKSLDELKAEANTLYQQMEVIGNLGIMMAANTGRILHIMKEKVPYGKWEEWCEDNLIFSKRKANRMMNLAEKLSDNESIFSKTTMLTDVGISKVWELLAAPEEVVEEVTKSADIEEISVKELKEEIKKTKTAYDMVRQEKESADIKVSSLELQIKNLEKNLEVAKESPTELAEDKKTELEALTKELGKAQEELSVLKAAEKENLKKAKEKLEAAKEKEIAKAVEEATGQFRTETMSAHEEAEKLKKLIENSNNEDVVAIKVNGTNLQQNFVLCLNSLDKIKEKDSEKGEKMQGYLRAIVASMVDQLGGIK